MGSPVAPRRPGGQARPTDHHAALVQKPMGSCLLPGHSLEEGPVCAVQTCGNRHLAWLNRNTLWSKTRCCHVVLTRKRDGPWHEPGTVGPPACSSALPRRESLLGPGAAGNPACPSRRTLWSATRHGQVALAVEPHGSLAGTRNPWVPCFLPRRESSCAVQTGRDTTPRLSGRQHLVDRWPGAFQSENTADGG